MRPALFRQDLIALFDLLQQKRIKPLIAERFSLAEARQAHELLGEQGVTGKVVLVAKGVDAIANLSDGCREDTFVPTEGDGS